MSAPGGLRIKIFADGADLARLTELARHDWIAGFTTNPTLMRKAGVADYEAFCRAALDVVGGRPISFEVFADDLDGMERQARVIAGWGAGVYVKIPVTNTQRESTAPLVRRLAADGIHLNVTAILTLEQVEEMSDALGEGAAGILSIFAGRIADTGRDPIPLVSEAVRRAASHPRQEILWASPREVLNLFHAEASGAHVITVTSDLLAKLAGLGRDLGDLSLDTVKMFHDDARSAGYAISESAAGAPRASR